MGSKSNRSRRQGFGVVGCCPITRPVDIGSRRRLDHLHGSHGALHRLRGKAELIGTTALSPPTVAKLVMTTVQGG